MPTVLCKLSIEDVVFFVAGVLHHILLYIYIYTHRWFLMLFHYSNSNLFSQYMTQRYRWNKWCTSISFDDRTKTDTRWIGSFQGGLSRPRIITAYHLPSTLVTLVIIIKKSSNDTSCNKFCTQSNKIEVNLLKYIDKWVVSLYNSTLCGYFKGSSELRLWSKRCCSKHE